MRSFCYFFVIAIQTIGTIVSGHAQSPNLRNKSIVYQAVDGAVKGYIYIAASGTIFWGATAQSIGLNEKNKGVRFKLNGSLNENHSGCQFNTTASMSGNILTLYASSSCPSLSTSDIQSFTVVISGDECSLTQSSQHSSPQSSNLTSTIRSTSCRIVPGNQIAG
jgi:fructose-1,6-bisphosphatase/inositol monophosphatase family enzyme